jgi:hypothetical protein
MALAYVDMTSVLEFQVITGFDKDIENQLHLKID